MADSNFNKKIEELVNSMNEKTIAIIAKEVKLARELGCSETFLESEQFLSYLNYRINSEVHLPRNIEEENKALGQFVSEQRKRYASNDFLLKDKQILALKQIMGDFQKQQEEQSKIK